MGLFRKRSPDQAQWKIEHELLYGAHSVARDVAEASGDRRVKATLSASANAAGTALGHWTAAIRERESGSDDGNRTLRELEAGDAAIPVTRLATWSYAVPALKRASREHWQEEFDLATTMLPFWREEESQLVQEAAASPDGTVAAGSVCQHVLSIVDDEPFNSSFVERAASYWPDAYAAGRQVLDSSFAEELDLMEHEPHAYNVVVPLWREYRRYRRTNDPSVFR